MAQDHVTSPQLHLNNLDQILSSRLRHGIGAKSATTPLARPPGLIRLVVLELSGEADGDEELLDQPLDRDDGNQTNHCVRGIPKLEEPLNEKRVISSAYRTRKRSKTY